MEAVPQKNWESEQLTCYAKDGVLDMIAEFVKVHRTFMIALHTHTGY